MKRKPKYWVRIWIFNEGSTGWFYTRRAWEQRRRELQVIGVRYAAGRVQQ